MPSIPENASNWPLAHLVMKNSLISCKEPLGKQIDSQQETNYKENTETDSDKVRL